MDGNSHKEIINENNELLWNLREQWRNEVCDMVISAFKEMNE